MLPYVYTCDAVSAEAIWLRSFIFKSDLRLADRFICHKQTLTSNCTLPSWFCERLSYIHASTYLCVNLCLNCYMSKRACHTITNYLNENHWQVRQVITGCAHTYISGPAMQNWICKKHFSPPPGFFSSSLLSSLYPPPLSSFALHPSFSACQLNDCCSFLSVSLSQQVTCNVSLPSLILSLLHVFINCLCKYSLHLDYSLCT